VSVHAHLLVPPLHFFPTIFFADISNLDLHSSAHAGFGKDASKYDVLGTLLGCFFHMCIAILMLICSEVQMLKLEEQQFLGEAICNLSEVCLL
jgi:hypothetical protein